MAGGLHVEVEEDVQLVENAAAASLFSPGMWVQRPQRTPRAARPGSTRDAELADQRGTCAASGDGTQRRCVLGSPNTMADPDLAYLNITDERDSAEKEYHRQDSNHMQALEEAHVQLREQNASVEQQLNGVVAAVNDVEEENRTIKQLLAMLQVQREDFMFNPQETIAAQQEAIGSRLLRNLEGSPPGSQQELQEQGDGGMCGQQQATRQQEQQQQAEQEQEQQQQQQHNDAFGSQQQHNDAFGSQQQQHASQSVAALTLLEMSPGGLLPLGTPTASFLRTVSPRIGAFRLSSGAAACDPATAVRVQAPPSAIPASPYDFPAESQIAAAALTAKQGDTAAALLTMLDKAIEGRMERQSAAAQVLAQAASDAQQQVYQLGPDPAQPPHL
ncbi:hypothetical protein ACK3TF_000562 [Chlorella vulgaris]